MNFFSEPYKWKFLQFITYQIFFLICLHLSIFSSTSSESLNSLYSPIFLFTFLPPPRQFYFFISHLTQRSYSFRLYLLPGFFPCHWYLSTNNLLIHRHPGHKKMFSDMVEWLQQDSLGSSGSYSNWDFLHIYVFSSQRKIFILLSVDKCQFMQWE